MLTAALRLMRIEADTSRSGGWGLGIAPHSRGLGQVQDEVQDQIQVGIETGMGIEGQARRAGSE